MEMSTSGKIGRSLWIAFCLFTGIFTIILTSLDFEKNIEFIGIFIVIEAIPHIFQMFKLRDHRIMASFVISLFSIGLICGIFVFFLKSMTLETACLIYGIYSIIRGIYLTISGYFLINIKKNKLPIVGIIVAIGDIVFGIILLLKKQAGIPGHLYYLGASFLVMSIMETIDYLYEK